ncbi:hypothetical protein BD769DRAFT_1397215 [Suillus cothurnatus]|nr:hypothetical protein BD769DRAFT_1397215 [Suillus cothurnatus]
MRIEGKEFQNTTENGKSTEWQTPLGHDVDFKCPSEMAIGHVKPLSGLEFLNRLAYQLLTMPDLTDRNEQGTGSITGLDNTQQPTFVLDELILPTPESAQIHRRSTVGLLESTKVEVPYSITLGRKSSSKPRRYNDEQIRAPHDRPSTQALPRISLAILVTVHAQQSTAINVSNKINEMKQCISIVMEDIRSRNETYNNGFFL